MDFEEEQECGYFLGIPDGLAADETYISVVITDKLLKPHNFCQPSGSSRLIPNEHSSLLTSSGRGFSITTLAAFSPRAKCQL